MSKHSHYDQYIGLNQCFMCNKCQYHYYVQQMSVSLLCATNVSITIMCNKCQYHYYVQQMSVSLLCATNVSITIMCNKCQYHYYVQQMSVSLLCATNVSITIMCNKCQYHYYVKQMSVSLLCATNVSITIMCNIIYIADLELSAKHAQRRCRRHDDALGITSMANPHFRYLLRRNVPVHPGNYILNCIRQPTYVPLWNFRT